MKRLSIIFLAIILCIAMVGCNNKAKRLNEQYEEAMSKGKLSVVDEEYDKAKEYFELALESKEDDQEAKNLIKQLQLFTKVIDMEDEDEYFEQLGKLDEIVSIKTETDTVKNKAIKYKDKIIDNIDDTIKDIEEDIEDGKYEKSQKNLENIIKECKKNDELKDQLEESTKLLEHCNEKKKDEEKRAKAKAKEESSKKEYSLNKDDDSEKVWCQAGHHYVDVEDYVSVNNRCYGCEARRNISSTMTYADCDYCGSEYSVSRNSGVYNRCGNKVVPGVVDIYNDGTIVFEDGSTAYAEDLVNY